MSFSAWSENDPAGSDAASSINEAATRSAVRIRERLATIIPDWSTATDRIHLEKIFLKTTNGLIFRDDGDANTHGSITDGGIVTWNKQPCCRLKKSTAYTLSNGSFGSVVFDVEDFDVGGMHDNAVNNTRVTIPANGAGIYLYSFHTIIGFPDTVNTWTAQPRIRKNGASDEVAFTTVTRVVGSVTDIGSVIPFNYTVLINAAAADYYEMQFNLNFSQTCVPFLSVIKVA